MLLALCLLFTTALLSAETAEGPEEGVLWTRLDIAAATGHDGWDAEGESFPEDTFSLNYLALGANLEYGVTPWASLYARWQPGYLYSVVIGEGDAGRMGDIQVGLRVGLLGERGLIKLGFLRLALLAGVKFPLPSGDDTVWEPDQRLWGADFGLSFDYIPCSWFQVNLSGDVLLNPEQISDNPAFNRQGVNHFMDTTFSVEPRFNILNPNGLMFGLPVVYEYSPESKHEGEGMGDERRFLWAGCSYTLLMRTISWPFEVSVQYLVPIDGMNQIKLQRLTLSGKVAIPIVKMARNAALRRSSKE
jgi:hypothetical protein